MNFKDIKELSLEDKQNHFNNIYGHKLKYVGNKYHIVERVLSLNKNSKPNPEKLAVIDGIFSLNLARKYSIRIKYLIICLEKIHSIEAQELIDSFINQAEESIIVSEKVFNVIAEKENSHGIMAVVYLPPKKFEEINIEKNSVVLILDGLEIPGNVGTILRSADATGIDCVIINNRKTRLNHPKLMRSSLGSVFKVPVVEAESFVELETWLKRNSYKVILTDTDATSNYYDLNYRGRIAIVMGSEKYGVSEDFYKMKYEGVKIPMLGDMDSLNVGVAATIIMYEAALKNKGYIKR